MSIELLKKAYGSGVIAVNLKGQRKVPYLEREKLERVRDQRIRSMVRYAARRVPYYRELFAREGVNPDEIRSARDLDRLPLLDKELVRSRPMLFVAESRAGRHGIPFRTSGTTGIPIEIFHDRRSLLANISYGERERAPFIEICGGAFRPKELYVGYDTSTFKTVTSFYRENVLFPVSPRRRFVSFLEPMAKVVEIMNEEEPDILVGYGGWISLFFRTAAAMKMDLKLPRMVMYMGEALPHGAREYIEGKHGIPVMSRYNAVEAFKIGFYCQHLRGFHIHEDLCHLRVVGPCGKTLPAGETGEVVISNLVNRATVLLNYPMGDRASIAPDPCTCGRTFRLISELEGRTEDILPLPDGRFIHPRAVWQLLKDERDVLQYQLVQIKPLEFQLQVVTLDQEIFPVLAERIVRKFKGLLGGEARIHLARRSDIINSPGQKFRVVVAGSNEQVSGN